jgi:hypothetical protein
VLRWDKDGFLGTLARRERGANEWKREEREDEKRVRFFFDCAMVVLVIVRPLDLDLLLLLFSFLFFFSRPPARRLPPTPTRNKTELLLINR